MQDEPPFRVENEDDFEDDTSIPLDKVITYVASSGTKVPRGYKAAAESGSLEACGDAEDLSYDPRAPSVRNASSTQHSATSVRAFTARLQVSAAAGANGAGPSRARNSPVLISVASSFDLRMLDALDIFTSEAVQSKLREESAAESEAHIDDPKGKRRRYY